MIIFYSKADYLIRHLLSEEESPDEFIKTHYPISMLEKSRKYLSLPTIRKAFDSYLKVSGIKNKLPASNILAIDVLVSACLKSGCTPIVIYLPNSDFWRPDSRSPNYLLLLAEYCKKSGVLFLDASLTIEDLGNQAYALKGPHLSPAGYGAISTFLLQNIQTLGGLLPDHPIR